MFQLQVFMADAAQGARAGNQPGQGKSIFSTPKFSFTKDVYETFVFAKVV